MVNCNCVLRIFFQNSFELKYDLYSQPQHGRSCHVPVYIYVTTRETLKYGLCGTGRFTFRLNIFLPY